MGPRAHDRASSSRRRGSRTRAGAATAPTCRRKTCSSSMSSPIIGAGRYAPARPRHGGRQMVPVDDGRSSHPRAVARPPSRTALLLKGKVLISLTEQATVWDSLPAARCARADGRRGRRRWNDIAPWPHCEPQPWGPEQKLRASECNRSVGPSVSCSCTPSFLVSPSFFDRRMSSTPAAPEGEQSSTAPKAQQQQPVQERTASARR